MDVVLEVLDTFVFDHAYAFLLPAQPAPYDFPNLTGANSTGQTFSSWQYKPATHLFSLQPSQAAYMSVWPRDNIYRQGISLYLITWFFGLVIYFLFASLSYLFVFDKAQMRHPKFIKNQVWLEIKYANQSMPGMALLTAPIFLAEVRGYGRLYDRTEDGPGWWYDILQFPLFLVFTDFCIYWIHRALHSPLLYKRVHKPHHKWIIPTPFASHAFHPLDGFSQGFPYHLYGLLFPLQKMAFIFLFVFVNFWTILIHDGNYVVDHPIINGAACHSLHHSVSNGVNYGQYTTVWDRLGGSYRKPNLAAMNAEIENLKKKEVKAE